MYIWLYFILVALGMLFFILGIRYAIESRNNKDNDTERSQKAGPLMYYFFLAMLFFSISAGSSVDIYTLDHASQKVSETIDGNITTYVYQEKCHECHIDGSAFAYLWGGMAIFSFILLAIYLIINSFSR